MFLPDLPDSCFRKAIHRNQLTANCRQIFLLARTSVSSSQEPKVVKSFLAESHDQNGVYHFYPSAKSRGELNIKIFQAHLPITSKNP